MRIKVNKSYIILETQTWDFFFDKESLHVCKATLKQEFIREFVSFKTVGHNKYNIVYATDKKPIKVGPIEGKKPGYNITITSDDKGNLLDYQDNRSGDWWSKEVFTIPCPYDGIDYTAMGMCLDDCRTQLREIFWKHAYEGMDVRSPLEFKLAVAVDKQLRIILDLQQPTPDLSHWTQTGGTVRLNN